MTKLIQYSCSDPRTINYLSRYWFTYDVDDINIWVTSVNRIRNFLENKFEIFAISKRLIVSLISESWGEVLWDLIDTNSNICTLIFVNITSFKERVSDALKNWEIRRY